MKIRNREFDVANRTYIMGFQSMDVSKPGYIQKMLRCMAAELTICFQHLQFLQLFLIDRVLPDLIDPDHGIHQSFTMERNIF